MPYPVRMEFQAMLGTQHHDCGYRSPRVIDATDGGHWLQSVKPTAEPPVPASRAATINVAIDRVGHEPVGWACEVGLAMACRIVEQIPEFGGGPGPLGTLRMCTESAVIGCMLRFAGYLRLEPALTDEALGGVVEFVQRGISLDSVLRGVRLGHALMAKAFLAACNDLFGDATRTSEMQYISDEMFDYVDGLSGALAAAYLTERDRWMTSAAATQGEAVRQILGEEPIDVPAVQRTLNYRFDQCHVAMTLWYDPALTRLDTAGLRAAACEVLDHIGAIQRIVIPVGAGRLWAWGNRRQFRLGDVKLDHISHEHPDVSLAIGTAAPGAAGFRRSHHEAVAAERVARMSRCSAGPSAITYADTAVAAMLTENVVDARHFVERELGPLAADTPAAADLRATLLCYFEEESSPFAAGRRLHISRNTVGYRVKRASELLGYDVASRRYSLHTALMLADRFGPTILADTSDSDTANPHRMRMIPTSARSKRTHN
jgi:PucR C-terminal helix-turn-helix domain/GGDEF-like domain